MSDAAPEPPVKRPPDGVDGELETAVLFVDLVASSDFASVLGLKEYATYVDSFEQLCREQCHYFFETLHKDKGWRAGRDYDFRFLGDELVVFMHTDNARQNIYQLLALAITLKCGWLGTPLNASRVAGGAPSAELAAGIHIGSVWAKFSDGGYKRRGFAINVAKRIESASREGQHYRIYMSDPAMKRVNRRSRNILFSPRKIVQMKGVVVPIGVYEVVDSFLDPKTRLAPELFKRFRKVALQAIGANSFDLWIHSCLQVSEEARNHGKKIKVTDENLELCRRTLNIDPKNACALHHAAQAMRERKDFESSRLYLEDLTNYWPGFADGWLELGRVLNKMKDTAGARHAILQARRCGVPPEEESLPGETPITAG
jgi:class 3 adenylate cyclase